jgi:hypothetical protein
MKAGGVDKFYFTNFVPAREAFFNRPEGPVYRNFT